jgi:glycosyltransferase involved in cell wall biosynthesis
LAGFVSAEELIRLYAGSRAAYYAPLNEDYGYVTVEAFLSRKPVVTTTDAGGPLEFVTHGETGLVAAPEPSAIAAEIDRLWAMPVARLREMGEAGRARVVDITWDNVIDRLTEGL